MMAWIKCKIDARNLKFKREMMFFSADKYFISLSCLLLLLLLLLVSCLCISCLVVIVLPCLPSEDCRNMINATRAVAADGKNGRTKQR